MPCKQIHEIRLCKIERCMRARTLYSRPIRSESTSKNTRLTARIVLALLLLKRALGALVLDANDGLDAVGDAKDSRVIALVIVVEELRPS